MFHHVLPPDIGNDGEGRLGMHDIGKILVRPNPQVDIPGLNLASEFRNHMQVGRLIRDEVMGVKEAFGFR